MKFKRYINCFLSVLICLVLLLLCSCNSTEIEGLAKYSLPKNLRMTGNGILAQNEKFSLEWDYEKQCVILNDNISGCKWATTPYDYYIDENKESEFYAENGLRSILQITYIEPEKNLEMQTTSYNNSLNNGYVSGKKIKNGIKLTYFFEEIKISIPVEFVLEEDGLRVSIVAKEIREKENKLYSISLSPFLASAKNNSDSYLFVPSGSGALMFTDDNYRASRKYVDAVYGGDATNQTIFKNSENESVRMPVFGVKNKENAIVGIITEGAESASINALAGDKQYGYSTVYASFDIRGKASALIKNTSNENSEVTKYSNPICNVERFSVKYITLSPEKANYNGMAEEYRNWLKKEYGLKKTESNTTVTIDFLGGVQTKKFLFGVPIETTDVLTDFNDVETILKDVLNETGLIPTVRLSGFGNSGLDYGELADNFKVSNIFGGKKGLKNLNDFCIDNNINLFLDFDTVFFSKSGGGYSVRKSATTANTVRAKYYYYDLVTHKQDTYKSTSYLLRRQFIGKISDDVLKSAKRYDLRGIGLSTLSNTAYSDYRSNEYYVKSNMAKDVINVYKNIKNIGYNIISDSANDYAAVYSDMILNVPITSSNLFVFDEDIPFYNIVFKGFVNLSSYSINLAANPIDSYLKAISVGSGLSFTCIDTLNKDFMYTNHSELSYCVYDDIKKYIMNFITQSKPFLENVKNTYIINYSKTDDVSETIFSNDIKVYVNYGDKETSCPLGALEPKSFMFGR